MVDFKAWLIIAGIYLAGCATVGLFWFITWAPVATSTLRGRVVSCEYHAAYTTMIPVQNGKTTTFVAQHHPAHWDCRIEASSTTFPATLYEPMRDGDRVLVHYHISGVELDNGR